MTSPAVSVLMPVHDGAPWVRDAHTEVLPRCAGARGRRGWRGLVEEMALIMAENLLASRRYPNRANVKNDERA